MTSKQPSNPGFPKWSEDQAKSGFCPLPWIHLSANTDTSMRVCCNTDHGGHVRDASGGIMRLDNVTSLRAAMNQETHKNLRSAMLRGERPDFCRRCYREEDTGGVSLRQLYLQHHTTTLSDAVAATSADGEIEPKVSFIDFSLTNNCNLQCRMCGPSSSFPLKKEFQALGFDHSDTTVTRAKEGWDFQGSLGRIVTEAAPNLKEMLTTGGEPFLSPQHLLILQSIIDHGRSRDVILRYHSNLTVLPDRLVELWTHFKSIEIHVSLEGVGPMNEYVRYPSKWDQITSNLAKLASLRSRATTPAIYCEIHTCLQALSWLRISELLVWTFEASSRLDGLFPRIPYPIWIDQPFGMTLDALPPNLRAEGAERLVKVLDRYQPEWSKSPAAGFEMTSAASFRAALQRLATAPYNPQAFQAFIDRTSKVDRYRGQSVSALIPEFEMYFSSPQAAL